MKALSRRARVGLVWRPTLCLLDIGCRRREDGTAIVETGGLGKFADAGQIMIPPTSDELFYTYKAGKLTIIGFDGRHLAGQNPERYQEALRSLLKQHVCEILVVDMMDVPVVRSWVLGILIALHKQGIRVELYHPTLTMREVLESTHLDTILHIRDGL